MNAAARVLRRAVAPAGPAGSRGMGSHLGARFHRQGNSGQRVTVFGAYGQLGRYVVGHLGQGGTEVIIPYRGDELEVRHLRPAGEVGAVVPVNFSPFDDDSIRRAIKGTDVVINLIGKDYTTTHWWPTLVNCSLDFTHNELAAKIARMSVEEGVQNLIHVSAMEADEYSISEYARAKKAGERAVREITPGACIVRPSTIFGPEDKFLNTYARMHEVLPRVLLVDGGAARVQPVFVEDVGQAIAALAMTDDQALYHGQTYDLAGPAVYTHKEVAEYVFEKIRAVKPEYANVSPAVADAIGDVFGLVVHPMLHKDGLRRWSYDNVLDELAPTRRLHDLGIEASSMESPGFTWLHRFRSGGHFLDVEEAEKKPVGGL